MGETALRRLGEGSEHAPVVASWVLSERHPACVLPKNARSGNGHRFGKGEGLGTQARLVPITTRVYSHHADEVTL